MSNQTRLSLVVRSIVPLHKVIPIEILGAYHLAKEFGNFSFKSSGNFLENALGNHGLPPEVFLFSVPTDCGKFPYNLNESSFSRARLHNAAQIKLDSMQLVSVFLRILSHCILFPILFIPLSAGLSLIACENKPFQNEENGCRKSHLVLTCFMKPGPDPFRRSEGTERQVV